MWRALGIAIIGGMTLNYYTYTNTCAYSMMAGYGVRRRRKKHRLVIEENR